MQQEAAAEVAQLLQDAAGLQASSACCPGVLRAHATARHPRNDVVCFYMSTSFLSVCWLIVKRNALVSLQPPCSSSPPPNCKLLRVNARCKHRSQSLS
jgi:hypothetical protein